MGQFSDAFKEEAVEYAAEIIQHRMELLVGINATSVYRSLEIMKQYRKYDFEAYVFMPPGKTSALDPVKSVLKVLDARGPSGLSVSLSAEQRNQFLS